MKKKMKTNEVIGFDVLNPPDKDPLKKLIEEDKSTKEIEKYILSTLDEELKMDGEYIDYESKINISKILGAHFKNFIQWVVEEPLIVRTDHDTWEVYKTQSDYEWGDNYEEKYLDDLHTYWRELQTKS